MLMLALRVEEFCSQDRSSEVTLVVSISADACVARESPAARGSRAGSSSRCSRAGSGSRSGGRTGVHFERLLELESTDANQTFWIHLALLAPEDLRRRVDLLDPRLNSWQLGFFNEVRLVEQNAIRESHLLNGLVLDALWLLVIQAKKNVFRIRDGDDAIQAELGLDVVVHKERLRDRRCQRPETRQRL